MWRVLCRAYRYLHLKDEEQIRQTNEEDEAAREMGVPLQWSIATDSSNTSTFMVTLPPFCSRQPRASCGVLACWLHGS